MGWVHWVRRNWDSASNEKGRNKIRKYEKLQRKYIVIGFVLGKRDLGLKNMKKRLQPDFLDFLLCAKVIYYKIASNKTSVPQQDSRAVHTGRESLRESAGQKPRGI